MSIKDLPHVTVEQVLVLRKEAIELERKLEAAEAKLAMAGYDAIKAAVKQCEYTQIGFYMDTVLVCDSDCLTEYADKLKAGEL